VFALYLAKRGYKTELTEKPKTLLVCANIILILGLNEVAADWSSLSNANLKYLFFII